MRYSIIILLSLASINLIGSGYDIDTLTIESEILAETRTLLVFTPDEIINSDSVSIIYMIDGQFSEYRFEEIINHGSKQTIGIGIINTDRRRDLLPINQADRFNRFIENELIPSVESNYLSNERILFGHSFGGAFTIFSMIDIPGLFNKYIASSPTPIMSLVDTDIYLKLDNQLKSDVKLYISYGSKDMRQVRRWSSRLIENLSTIQTDRLHWKNELFDGKDHNTSDRMAIISGLNY